MSVNIYKNGQLNKIAGNSGGSGGTTNYTDLINKPKINNIELNGNKTLDDLGIQSKGNYITTEVDPTVPTWAKQDNKPTYTKEEVGLGNVPNVSTDNQTPTFTENNIRENIQSGETLKILFGKIKKWFTDLKTVAFSGSYNDLSDKPTIPSKTSEITNDSNFVEDANYEHINIATTNNVGIVKPDGNTVTVDADGTIHSVGGGESGTSNYNNLTNKPKINNVELSGNKTLDDLGIQKKGTYIETEVDPTVPSHVKSITEQDIVSWNGKSDFSGSYNDLSDKPTIPTKTSELTNNSNFVEDSYYVHTDNNYTTEEKQKLADSVNTKVKGQSEDTYRNGEVNLTQENLGIWTGTQEEFEIASQAGEIKNGSIINIKDDFNSSDSIDILDTMEEIETNEQSGKVAGALVVKELNTDIKNIGEITELTGTTQTSETEIIIEDINNYKWLYLIEQNSGITAIMPVLLFKIIKRIQAVFYSINKQQYIGANCKYITDTKIKIYTHNNSGKAILYGIK